MLGGEGVTEKNVMQYLGVLEQRTSELLAHYLLLASDGAPDAASERATAVLTGKAAASEPLRFVIEPPSTVGGLAAGGAAGGADDAAAASLAHFGGPAFAPAEDERPLSRGSLAARAARAVAARADTAVKIKALRGCAPSRPGSLRRA